MDPSQITIPPLKDLTIENITPNVHMINSFNNDSARLKYVLERLVTHLHDFARETRLSTAEWMAGIQFLTKTGQTCTDVRQEFILLSDILGLSLLVDSMDHPKPTPEQSSGATVTEGTVLGPFHTHEAHLLSHGELISHDEAGEPLLVVCTVKDQHGRPIPDVKIDIWETDSTGHYDVQHPDHSGPDGRCVLKSDQDGVFWFKAIVPVPYPIPHDGPVGQLLLKLGRHAMRPAHMHFMFEKEGWDHLITALYLRGDPYETSDAVFGVKESLIVNLASIDLSNSSAAVKAKEESEANAEPTQAQSLAKKYDIKDPKTKVLTYDFVLMTQEESNVLRDVRARDALAKLGRTNVRIIDGLPVPEDVD